jgi:hypothetical protein
MGLIEISRDPEGRPVLTIQSDGEEVPPPGSELHYLVAPEAGTLLLFLGARGRGFLGRAFFNPWLAQAVLAALDSEDLIVLFNGSPVDYRRVPLGLRGLLPLC